MGSFLWRQNTTPLTASQILLKSGKEKQDGELYRR